jgi:hypothetical protein
MCIKNKPESSKNKQNACQSISIHRIGGIVPIHSCNHENSYSIRKQHMNSNITITKTDGIVTANLLQHDKHTHACTHTHTHTHVSIKWNVWKEHYKLKLTQVWSKNCQTGCKVTVLHSLEFLYCMMIEYSILNSLLLILKLMYVLFRSDTQWSKDTCSAITELYVPTEWHTLKYSAGTWCSVSNSAILLHEPMHWNWILKKRKEWAELKYLCITTTLFLLTLI